MIAVHPEFARFGVAKVREAVRSPLAPPPAPPPIYRLQVLDGKTGRPYDWQLPVKADQVERARELSRVRLFMCVYLVDERNKRIRVFKKGKELVL